MRLEKIKEFNGQKFFMPYRQNTYICPCGKGKIVEHLNKAPGYPKLEIEWQCYDCKRKYKVSVDKVRKKWNIEKREVY